jgi:hypothetical protein
LISYSLSKQAVDVSVYTSEIMMRQMMIIAINSNINEIANMAYIIRHSDINTKNSAQYSLKGTAATRQQYSRSHFADT